MEKTPLRASALTRAARKYYFNNREKVSKENIECPGRGLRGYMPKAEHYEKKRLVADYRSAVAKVRKTHYSLGLRLEWLPPRDSVFSSWPKLGIPSVP